MSNRTDRTRAVLQRCALELFLRDGYDATTVAAIAGAAGVSHMTFFRHFPTKESVVLDDPYDPIIAERVAAQPATLPALERVRRGFAQAWADVPEPMDAEVRARIRLVAGHPALRARMWENTQRTERAVVDALLAGGVPRLQALVAAATCLGALTAARSEPFCAGLAGSSDRRNRHWSSGQLECRRWTRPQSTSRGAGWESVRSAWPAATVIRSYRRRRFE